MPGIGDQRFERAVIAMCVHDDDGALGIMANRAHDSLTVRGLMEQLDVDPGITPDVPVLFGGPVEPGRGFVLHSPDYSGQSTVEVGSAATGRRPGVVADVDDRRVEGHRIGSRPEAVAGGARLYRLVGRTA